MFGMKSATAPLRKASLCVNSYWKALSSAGVVVLILVLGVFQSVSLIKGVQGSGDLYSSSSPVKVLAGSEFKTQVLESNDLWIVEFFASWCGHCSAFAPEYEKAARALNGVVKVAAVEDQSVMRDFGVKGFPTVKAIVGNGGKGSHKSFDYNGARTAEGVVNFALEQQKDLVQTRLHGKKSSKGGGGGGRSDVVVLTDANFDKELLKDEKNAWFVEFYAPWCGHCKSLAPDWERLASEVKGKVVVAKVDATKETSLARKFEIQGFPTLKMFPVGEKSVKGAVTYDGPRSLKDLTSFSLQFHSPTTETVQLLDEKQFRDSCSKGLCVLVFLPHIYDTSAEERNSYLKQLNLVARSSTTVPFTFLWCQGGDQQDLEEQLNLSFGYPALVAISLEKQMYSVHRGNFNQESIRSFLRMKNAVEKLPETVSEIVTVEKWDGTDAAPPKDPLDELLEEDDEDKAERKEGEKQANADVSKDAEL